MQWREKKCQDKMHDTNQVQPPSSHRLGAVPTGQTTLVKNNKLNETAWRVKTLRVRKGLQMHGVSKCCRALSTVSAVSRTLTKSNAVQHCKFKINDQIDAKQGLSPFCLATSEQEAPAVWLPWYDHVHRSTRESSHAPSHGA